MPASHSDSAANLGPDALAAPASTATAGDDQLTLSRLLVLMAGAGVGLNFFLRESWPTDPHPGDVLDYAHYALGALMHGLALPAPWYVLRRAWKQRGAQRARLGLGAFVWLTWGLGAWTMFPLIVESGARDLDSCLLYVMGLGSAFMLSAGWLSRQVRLRRGAGFCEQVGWCVALGWFPTGARLIWDLYSQRFSFSNCTEFLELLLRAVGLAGG